MKKTTDRVRDRVKTGATDPKGKGKPTGKADASKPAADTSKPPKEWQEPRPPRRELLPVPQFDFRLLPLEIRGWVSDAAHRMQVAPDIIAAAAMCALGVVIANARTIHPMQNDPYRVHTNVWGVVISPPGAKKSPAIAVPNRMLARLEQAERERHEKAKFRRAAEEMMGKARDQARKGRIRAGAAGEEGGISVDDLAAELEAEACAEQKEKLRRILTTDTTIEKLGDLVANGNLRCRPMIVWCDELAGLLATFNRDGHEGDRSFYNAGWSVQHHTVDRVTRGSLFLRHLTLSIFGAMTPEPFEKCVREATDGANADGFLQRFQLMVYPDPPPKWQLVDQAPDQVAEARARALFDRVFAIDDDDAHGMPRALNFTTEAQELYYRWITELEARIANPGNRLTAARVSHLSKYRGLMPAIALICHVASRPGAENEQVTIEATERARAWCAYLDAHADRVYALASDNGWIESELVRRIEAGKLVGTITLRKIQRTLPGDPKADHVHAACEALEELGWLTLGETKGAGRPSPIAHINPLGCRTAAATAAPATEATS